MLRFVLDCTAWTVCSSVAFAPTIKIQSIHIHEYQVFLVAFSYDVYPFPCLTVSFGFKYPGRNLSLIGTWRMIKSFDDKGKCGVIGAK